MSEKINKSSLHEAKASFEEIKKFAIEEATKNLQGDVSKKVIELMNSINENDSESNEEVLQEEVTINVDSTKITIDDNGAVDIESSSSNEEELSDDEAIDISDEDDEIEIDGSDEDIDNLEEMTFEEEENPMAAPAPTEQAPAPAETAPLDAAPEMEEPTEEQMANPFQSIEDKLDTLINLMGGQAGGDSEEIDIIDDTDMAGEQGPAPAAPAAPVAEEITFEVVNNEMEIPEMSEDNNEVLEIVEDEEDTMEEMHGVGHNLRHSNRLAILPGQGVEHRQGMNENTAQYEAKIAELIKENESLKSEREGLEQELIKFENGFLKLQENFGEMQDYQAKLVMAYKVAMSGGLTSEEKVQISEQFDACETVEEAEKLYKSIVSEHKIKVNKNPEKSIKSNSIKSSPAKSVSQPLYESNEILRMKQLAGIKKLED